MAWLIALILFSLDGWKVCAVEYKLEGKSYITYSASAKSFSKTSSTIHMLFRTAEISGVLLHARGTSGDFITLEIVRGKLRYASVFGRDDGRPGTYNVTVGDDLGDDQWHQIDIERKKNHVVIKLDIEREYLTAQRDKKYQNINQDIAVAGIPPSTKDIPSNSSIPRVSLARSIFKGCMEDVSFNKINIFQAIKEKSNDVRVFGNLHPKCADDAKYDPPAALTKSTSFIKVDVIGGQDINLKLKFRTFDHSGVLTHYSFGSTGQLFLELVQGKLTLSCGSKNFTLNATIAHKNLMYADGVWHKVQLTLTSKGATVHDNNDKGEIFFNASGIKDLFQNSMLRIGTSFLGKSSMKGCVREIQLNGKNVAIKSTMVQAVDLDKCYLNDHCFTSPCLHKGVCKQHNNIVQCDCTNTGYYGERCENISALPYHNTTSTQNVNTESPSILRATIKPSRTISEVIMTTSKIITTVSDVAPSTSKTEIHQPISLATFTKQGTIPTTKITNSKLLVKSSKTSNAKPKHAITTMIMMPTTLKPVLTTQLKQPISSTQKQISSTQAKQETTSIRKQTSITQLKQCITSVPTPPTSTTPTTMEHISPLTILPQQPKHSVRLTLSTAQNPTHRINSQIIIIQKSNTITNVGFNKNQLLVYLFLFILFVLFVGLIIIISVKLSYFQACSCFSRFQTDNGSIRNQDSIELGHADRKDSIRGVNQSRIKTGRPSSLNDSGIDRSDSGTGSQRNSAEVNDEAISNRRDLETRIEDDPMEGFLILQEEPALFTQQSFGWTVLNSSSTIRQCRTSTRDLIHAADENKPRAFRPAYYPHADISGNVAEDDVTDTSASRYNNPTTKYRQLSTSDSSSLDNVSVDYEQCNWQRLEEKYQETVEEQLPVF